MRGVETVGTLPLLVEFFAGRRDIALVSCRPLLEPGCFRCLGLGLRLGGAGPRGGFVGECFAPLDLHGFLTNLLADAFGFDATLLGAALPRDENDSGDQHDRDHDRDDYPDDGIHDRS